MTLRLVLELGLEAQAEFSFTGSAVALSAGTRVSWRWGILIKGTCEPGLQCVMCASQVFFGHVMGFSDSGMESVLHLVKIEHFWNEPSAAEPFGRNLDILGFSSSPPTPYPLCPFHLEVYIFFFFFGPGAPVGSYRLLND